MLIYRIENLTNGKVYIGQTIRSFKERLGEHKRSTKSTIGNAIRKYGEDSFKYEIVYETDCLDDLNLAEQAWICKENCLAPKGYNLVHGGGNTKGYSHTDETKELMRSLKLGGYLGKDNPFYGKRHSKETRERLSKAHIGKKLTETHRSKIAEANKVKVRNVTTGEIFDSVKEASQSVGVAPSNVTRVCKGGRKTAGGTSWEYI